MTRCMRNEVNLKSTAYNQTGQNYFEQLAAYNSMSQHLRRILLARSVVDSRNKNYMCRRNRRSKPADDRRICSLSEMTDEIIDRLVFDTQHHPMDVLRMNINPESRCCNCNLEYRRSRNCGRPCCRASNQTTRRQRSTSRSQRSTSPTTASKHTKFAPNTVCGMEFKTTQKSPCAIGSSSMDLPRQRKYRHETDPVFVSCTTTTLNPSESKPTYHSPTQETNDHRSVSLRSPRSHDDSNHDDKAVQRPASRQEYEKKYINFIYDITREIKQNGLYTDKELQDVFKKHMNKNKGILDTNRMLYEIYQLKISLNILDDGSDDELEDLIHAQTLLHVSEIRSPTPPKVLDESKIIEKSYQKSMDQDTNNNPIRIAQRNPVTVKDLMGGVIETQLRREDRLPQRSLDLYPPSEMQKETDEGELKLYKEESEVSYSSQFENSQESRYNDRSTSLPYDISAKQDANSSTSNLASTQDEAIETVE